MDTGLGPALRVDLQVPVPTFPRADPRPSRGGGKGGWTLAWAPHCGWIQVSVPIFPRAVFEAE